MRICLSVIAKMWSISCKVLIIDTSLKCELLKFFFFNSLYLYRTKICLWTLPFLKYGILACEKKERKEERKFIICNHLAASVFAFFFILNFRSKKRLVLKMCKKITRCYTVPNFTSSLKKANENLYGITSPFKEIIKESLFVRHV